MAEIAKWQSRQVLPIIRHNMRRLSDGNVNGNKSIQPELIQQNYSLIDRGSTCNEINQYRKQIEKDIHMRLCDACLWRGIVFGIAIYRQFNRQHGNIVYRMVCSVDSGRHRQTTNF